MDANKTENYIPHLDSLLHGYNNSTHSTIGISPNLAWNDKSTHPQIRERLQKYYNKFRKRKPRFKIGDVVRKKNYFQKVLFQKVMIYKITKNFSKFIIF